MFSFLHIDLIIFRIIIATTIIGLRIIPVKGGKFLFDTIKTITKKRTRINTEHTIDVKT